MAAATRNASARDFAKSSPSIRQDPGSHRSITVEANQGNVTIAYAAG